MGIGDDAVEVRASGWRTLAALHGLIETALERELRQRHDLSVVEFTVLDALSRQDGWHMRMAQLARAAALSSSATTRLVNRLEERRLLRRILCEDDRRGIYTELTPAGLHAARSAPGPPTTGSSRPPCVRPSRPPSCATARRGAEHRLPSPVSGGLKPPAPVGLQVGHQAPASRGSAGAWRVRGTGGGMPADTSHHDGMKIHSVTTTEQRIVKARARPRRAGAPAPSSAAGRTAAVRAASTLPVSASTRASSHVP